MRCDRSGSVCKRSVVALTIFLALHRRDGAYPFSVAAIRRVAAVQDWWTCCTVFCILCASVAWLMTWETVEFMTADSGCIATTSTSLVKPSFLTQNLRKPRVNFHGLLKRAADIEQQLPSWVGRQRTGFGYDRISDLADEALATCSRRAMSSFRRATSLFFERMAGRTRCC